VKNIHEQYNILAKEYYDPKAHPTCYAFNLLSRSYIEQWITEPSVDCNILEVGAGDSCVASILHERGFRLGGLEITDASPAMLAYSERWAAYGAKLGIADAHSLHCADKSVSLLVASLGDSYNLPEVWAEIARVTEPGGAVLFTVPSFQWAARFRANHLRIQDYQAAHFELRDGTTVSVPSFIWPLDEQVKMIEKAGLMVVHFESLGERELPPGRHSPKIDVFSGDISSLIWGFKAIRQRLSLPLATHQC